MAAIEIFGLAIIMGIIELVLLVLVLDGAYERFAGNRDAGYIQGG